MFTVMLKDAIFLPLINKTRLILYAGKKKSDLLPSVTRFFRMGSQDLTFQMICVKFYIKAIKTNIEADEILI